MTIRIIFTCIIVTIAIYYYIKQKKAEDLEKENEKLAQEKILKYYRDIYKSIPKDNRLPSYRKNNYVLEDIALTATQIIYENPIPTAKEISNLKPGCNVKLLFVDKEGYTERMWVEYIEEDNGLLKGILRNDAYDFDRLKEGEIIYFHPNHVYDINQE